MKYNEIIRINKSFQYSINLQYDLLNLEKVLGYIPTKQSVEILKEYLMNIEKDSNDKATVLIGPYGKGKSHLLLVLISIIYSKDSKIKNSLLKKLKIDKTTRDLANSILNNERKLLPIIINSNNIDLKQSFLIALNDAIKREKLDEIELNTYFDTVKNIILLWKKSYPQALEILSDELRKINIKVDDFIKQIESYSSDAYQLFLNIYPIISSGVEFNPMVNTDIVKLYEEFTNKLCEKYDYRGIFIVFDEFSKFIEGSVDKNNAIELKMLQDFAELANRSKGNQIHLACITHKSINQYISKIPTSRIDAWRAIEGRFRELHFTTSSKQNFELIGNTINIKDEESVMQCLENKKISRNYEDAFLLYDDIYDEETYEKEIKINCFPLNAVTTYTLPRVSEKVAQNERTLFTFLCKQGNNTLWYFNKINDIGNLLEIDVVYNYFENLFKKEIFNEKIRDIWVKTDSLLQKINNEDEKKVIKALGVINIVDDFEKLKPNRSTLKTAFLSIDNIDVVIDRLLENGYLIERKNNAVLDYMPGISIDINQHIEDTIKSKLKKIDFIEELNNIFPLEYVTPKRYNDENLMIRFFENKFMSATEVLGYANVNHILDELDADGKIINLIYRNKKELEEIKDKFFDTEIENVVFNIPKKEFIKEYEVLKLLAIKYLKNDLEFLEQDEAIFDYLEIMEDDMAEELGRYIFNNFEIDNENSELIICGKKQNICSHEKFNKLISQICDRTFKNTVKINNEMINKKKITTPILKARTKVIDWILNEELEYEGNSPEVTIARATIKSKGIDIGGEVQKDIQNIIKGIREIILDNEGSKIEFKKIYDYLERFEYGIRMRKGVIPIYLAYILKEFSDKIVIYFGQRNSKEMELDSKTLNIINENPEEYFLKLDIETKEKEIYFGELEKVFKNYSGKRKNKNKYLNLVNNMQEWIKSLDNFTRNHNKNFVTSENIEKENILLRRELLKYDINSREFIFETLPKIYKTNDYNKIYENIINSKRYFDNRNREIKNNVIKWTKDNFIEEYKGSLSEALKKWNRDLESFKKEYLYDVVTNRLLETTKVIDENNEERIIDDLSFIFTGLSINDWNDITYEKYREALSESLRKINDLQELKINNQNEEIISFKVNGELGKEKRFSKEEITPLGSTLLNELEEVVEEYGAALTDNEKRTILFNLLEKLM